MNTTRKKPRKKRTKTNDDEDEDGETDDPEDEEAEENESEEPDDLEGDDEGDPEEEEEEEPDDDLAPDNEPEGEEGVPDSGEGLDDEEDLEFEELESVVADGSTDSSETEDTETNTLFDIDGSGGVNWTDLLLAFRYMIGTPAESLASGLNVTAEPEAIVAALEIFGITPAESSPPIDPNLIFHPPNTAATDQVFSDIGSLLV